MRRHTNALGKLCLKEQNMHCKPCIRFCLLNQNSLTVLLTRSSQHFWHPSHCAWSLIGWPFQSVILQSEAINFHMQHHSDDDASNGTIWSFGSHGPPRKTKQLRSCQTFVGMKLTGREKGFKPTRKRWHKWERNDVGDANQAICINITPCQSILIKNGDKREDASYNNENLSICLQLYWQKKKMFSIFSNHIINLKRVIQAKPASQRSEYANANFCARLFI